MWFELCRLSLGAGLTAYNFLDEGGEVETKQGLEIVDECYHLLSSGPGHCPPIMLLEKLRYYRRLG